VVTAVFPVVVVMVVVMVMAVMVFAVAAFVCQRWSSKQHHCYKAARHNGHYPTSQHFTSWGLSAYVTGVHTQGRTERLA
jgi:hypothetical protein